MVQADKNTHTHDLKMEEKRLLLWDLDLARDSFVGECCELLEETEKAGVFTALSV